MFVQKTKIYQSFYTPEVLLVWTVHMRWAEAEYVLKHGLDLDQRIGISLSAARTLEERIASVLWSLIVGL
jgi:hypothetical protein